MPELAETALIARDLSKKFKQATIKEIEFGGDYGWGQKIIPQDVRDAWLSGLHLSPSVESRGKSIFIDFGHHKVEVKLGMTGRFQDKPLRPGQHEKHSFVNILLDDGSTVHFVDYRRFGRMYLATHKDPDTLRFLGGYKESGFFIRTPSEIRSMMIGLPTTSRKPRITWLLDTGVDTGVGNYLANDALGRLNLSPFEPFLSHEEILNVLICCGEIAQSAFDHGGNSFAGGYVKLDGSYGEFEKYCKFYRAPQVPRKVFKGRPVYTYF